MSSQSSFHRSIMIGAIACCFLPFTSPAIALSCGLLLASLGINSGNAGKMTSPLLQASIVFMGFSMKLDIVIQTWRESFFVTMCSVIITLSCGWLLGRFLKVSHMESLLISVGTAICGGSAIATTAPVLKAHEKQIVMAMIVIFILNAIALYIFPPIGHHFHLSQEAFGYWAAIAIHDTSSVVGAAAEYGTQALETATVVKLTRALWIIPLCLTIALVHKGKGESSGQIKFPWFIVLFIGAILINHFIPGYPQVSHSISWLGRRGMVIALFLIGSSIQANDIRKAGLNSFILGICLWAIIGGGSLIYILTATQ